jgi:hypothetical protein
MQLDSMMLEATLTGLNLRLNELRRLKSEIETKLRGKRPPARSYSVSGTTPNGAEAPATRRMSTAGREAIAAAQRKRWNKIKRAKTAAFKAKSTAGRERKAKAKQPAAASASAA